VLKTVHCESCHAEYVYRLERTRTGSGTSDVLFFDAAGATERATQEAHKKLRHSLQDGVDLVPCPACGWYQQDMVCEGKERRYGWMVVLGLVLIVGLFPLAMIFLVICSLTCPPGPPLIPWQVMLASLVTVALMGTFLLAAGWILPGRYDPNDDDPEARIQLGRSRALLREEIERKAPRHEAIDPAAQEELARIRELILESDAATQTYDCWMDCPCGASIGLTLHQAGKTVSCNACARKLLIPLALSKGTRHLPSGVDTIF
jgi:hypothetical protein